MKTKAIVLSAIFVLAAALAIALVSCSSGGNDKASNVATQAPEVTSSDAPSDEPVAQVAAQVSPAVVQVNVKGTQNTPVGPQSEQGIGSGVIYRKDGYIITNNHVVQDANEVNVAFADGSTENAEVVGKDPTTDIAVVKVNRSDLPAATFAGGSGLTVGQLAVAIGSPQGFQSTVTSGVISGLNRSLPSKLTGNSQESQALVDLIQTSAPISPGNSGGALAIRDGEIAGINVAYLPPQETGAESIGFAIPSEAATSIADQLIQNGRATHAYLGIGYTDLSQEIADQYGFSVQKGVIVTSVASGSPAADAGLRPEDVITALGSSNITNAGDLLAALRGYNPGDNATLTVVRGGKGNQEDIQVKLGERQQ
ncbi:MAG TPA: trypsin-like peptidase domain-containing protein [Rubrobacteraceae bacterium]|nr:trypsin-like peptidase domain-containing protein [Rubrobacteraceae bacterium]